MGQSEPSQKAGRAPVTRVGRAWVHSGCCINARAKNIQRAWTVCLALRGPLVTGRLSVPGITPLLQRSSGTLQGPCSRRHTACRAPAQCLADWTLGKPRPPLLLLLCRCPCVTGRWVDRSLAEKGHNRGLGAPAPEGPAGEEAPTREGGQGVRSLGPRGPRSKARASTVGFAAQPGRARPRATAGASVPPLCRGSRGHLPQTWPPRPSGPVSVRSVSECVSSLLAPEASALNSG